MLESTRLKRRWNTNAGKELAAEALARIAAGAGLADLPLDRVDGRVDLRGIRLPEPAGTEVHNERFKVISYEGITEWRGVRLADIEFSFANLEHLRLFNCAIDRCKFERAFCRRLRMWRTRIASSTFSGANLRDGALGAFTEPP